MAKYIKVIKECIVHLKDFHRKVILLEETCASQRERLHLLEQQLGAANEELKMVRTLLEKKKRSESDLQDRLAKAEMELETEKKRKKRKLE